MTNWLAYIGIYTLGMVLCVAANWGIQFFLRTVFDYTPRKISGWIGILERLLLFWVITMTGQFGIVGWVLAAKAVARFARAEDPHESGIYFVGTLLSLLLGLAISVGTMELLP